MTLSAARLILRVGPLDEGKAFVKQWRSLINNGSSLIKLVYFSLKHAQFYYFGPKLYYLTCSSGTVLGRVPVECHEHGRQVHLQRGMASMYPDMTVLCQYVPGYDGPMPVITESGPLITASGPLITASGPLMTPSGMV